MWYWPRKFIQYGYRANVGYLDSTKSICKIHNETGNIWSHLLGFIFLSYRLWQFSTGKFDDVFYSSTETTVITSAAMISGMICLYLSTQYHTFCDIGPKEYHFFLQYDFLGIIIMIFGYAFAGIWLAFTWHPKDR